MLTEATVDGVLLELVDGDIARQPEFDAVVNAANSELLPGGGVAGAIHRAAGPALSEECRELAPIEPGQCVISAGHGLPNTAVIHCLGPVYGVDSPAAELLASCYREALELAEARQLGAVAFPAISTGAFGYPLEAAAEIAIREVLRTTPRLRHVKRVRFVLSGEATLDAHRTILGQMTDTAAEDDHTAQE